MKKMWLLLALLLVAQSPIFGQALTGTKTINPSGGDYTSFTSAINALNVLGVGVGGVTFKVAAGTTFFESQNYVTTTTSNEDNPIVFEKDGAGANPVIYGKVVSGSDYDVIIGIRGSDYITIDGIDLISDPSAVNDADKIEYGILIFNNDTYGCDHITIKNCKIIVDKRDDLIDQNGINIWQNSPSITGIISNVLVDNVDIIKGRTSILIYAETIPNENIEVKNCNLGEEATVIEPYNYGAIVRSITCKNFSFHGNEIQNIVSSNFYVLQLNNFTGENNIYNNRIHNLRATSTDENDILIISPNSSDPNAIMNIYNNLIYDFDGAKSIGVLSSNTYWNLQALQLAGTAKYKVYNNTIVGSSVNPNENTILCWATPNSEIKNNIFADFSVAGENSYRTLFLTSSIVENNLFWIDESLANNYTYRSGNNSYTFREWQKWTTVPSPGYFLTNMSANPNFTDRENFVFTLINPSPASNNGQPLGIVTTSLNDIARNATTPDIGAYEGDFGPATDLFPPIIRFQPIPYNSLSEVKLVTEITDNVGVIDANLWFRVKGSASTFSQVAGAQYGNIWEFTFPALDPDTYEYFVCAKDASGNIISNGYIISGLDVTNTGLEVNNPAEFPDYVYSFAYNQVMTEGTYTVGTGGNYNSLTQPGGLFDAINSSLIGGNIEATIISDLVETGEIKLNQWQESGAGNYTLTIKPNSTELRTVTNITTIPINILGADKVIIDGSYNGDLLNHLKFVADNTNTFVISSTGTNGCSNITLKNCDFYAPNVAVIVAQGNFHTDLIFENLNSVKGSTGLSLTNVTRPIIRNCTFGNTDVNNTLTFRGIYLIGCLDINIENNTIQNIINVVDNRAAYGIILNNTAGGSISKNKITSVINNAVIGNATSIGLSAEYSKNITVSNNIISGINGYGLPNFTGTTAYNMGIQGAALYNCDNIKLYYNTLNLYGEGNTVINGECYILSTEKSVNLEICNNIFSNTIENTNTSYSMGIVQQSAELSNIFKNNLHYVGGPKAYPYPYWIINETPSAYFDFSGWQSSGFKPGSGRDLGSGFGDPAFTNSAANDVSLLSSSPALNSGIPLSVTTDFFGNPRDPSSPDMGAIEDNSLSLTADIIAPVIEFIPFTNSVDMTPTFSATITDNSGVAAAKMWYRLNGSSVAFTSIDGVKQGDEITWNFTVTTPLTEDTKYEYFICAKDAANNIITNGISTVTLDAASVGLLNNSPEVYPSFARTFGGEELLITIGALTGDPYHVSASSTASVSIPFTKTGTFNYGNIFTAFLSDASGNFSSETAIGSKVAGSDNPCEGAYLSVGFREHPTAGILPFNTILQFTGVNSNTVHKPQIGDYPGYGLDITITGETMEVEGVTVYKCDLQITGMAVPSDMGVYDTYNGEPMNYYNPITKVFELYYFYNIAAPRNIRETNSRIDDNGNIIDGIISSSTPAGTGYKIRIKSSSPAGIISDSSPQFQVIVEDNITPVVTLVTSATTPVFEPFIVTINFNEEVQGFVQSMITVTNATLSDFSTITANRNFTVLVTPENTGTVTVKVAANVVKDLSDNFNGESNTISLSYIELDAPHLNISATGDVYYFNTSSILLTFSFDQDVTGFEAGDIAVINGSVSDFATLSPDVYTAVLTPAGQGLTEITVPDDVASNIAAKGNSSSSLNLTYDNILPGVTLSRVSGSGTVNSLFNIYIDFTEEIKGMTLDKLTVTNGTASDLIKESGTKYRAVITPSIPEGIVTISFMANIITDMADNNNTSATVLEVDVDLVDPSLIITRTSGSGSVNSTFNVTFTFSEDVTGFDLTDISVTNGTADNFVSENAIIYTADITPDLVGDVIIYTAAGVARDLAGNLNTEASPLTIEIVFTGQEKVEENIINVFPNPSTGLFRIEVQNASSQPIKIIDLNGKPVYTNVLKNNVTEFDLSYLPKGTYLIQILEGNKINLKQIILL